MFAALQDPDHNVVVEVHNYLDPNQSGTYTSPIASTNVGSQQLAAAIAWSEQTGIKLYVGETGTPSDNASVAALSRELFTIDTAGGSFWGVSLWSAGPWWPSSYVMDLNPVNGVIAPQMVALAKYATKPETLVLALSEDAYQGNAQYTVKIGRCGGVGVARRTDRADLRHARCGHLPRSVQVGPAHGDRDVHQRSLWRVVLDRPQPVFRRSGVRRVGWSRAE